MNHPCLVFTTLSLKKPHHGRFESYLASICLEKCQCLLTKFSLEQGRFSRRIIATWARVITGRGRGLHFFPYFIYREVGIGEKRFLENDAAYIKYIHAYCILKVYVILKKEKYASPSQNFLLNNFISL